MWLEEGAGFRGCRTPPPTFLLKALPEHSLHAQTHSPHWQRDAAAAMRDPGKSDNRVVGKKKKSNPGMKRALCHMRVIFKGRHCCFPRQQRAARQLGWAGDQGAVESYQLQPRWACCLQQTESSKRREWLRRESWGDLHGDTTCCNGCPRELALSGSLGRKAPGTGTAGSSLQRWSFPGLLFSAQEKWH